jgi:hypothetical protein
MEVPAEDEEEKYDEPGSATKFDRHGTVAGAPLADQFDEDEGPDFSEEGMANSNPKSSGGRKTLTSQYKCNNGKMVMSILASE